MHPDGVVPGEVWRFRVRHLAFPGAEGYGRFAIGGRGGRVIEVTNLQDGGPGSLRTAVEGGGPRTVAFQVGGTIRLKSRLVVRHPYLTVAGQTAPGDGICIRGATFGCEDTHDVTIRHVRIRVGDESGQTFARPEAAEFRDEQTNWRQIDRTAPSREVRAIGGPGRRLGLPSGADIRPALCHLPCLPGGGIPPALSAQTS